MLVVHETVPRDPAHSLFCREQVTRVFDCPYHRHPEFEVVRIDESRGRMLAGDYAGTFRPGEIYVFAGGLPHAFINDPDTRRAQSRFIQFDPAPLYTTLEQWPELQMLHRPMQRAGRGLRLAASACGEVSRQLDLLFEKTGGDRISELLNLLARIAECPGKELAGEGYELLPPERQIRRLEAVLGRIHAEPGEMPDIQSLADTAGMSVSAFHRFFRKRLGCTPGTYILNLRFSAIARRLIESEDSVSEIAFAAGFNNLSNFNRQFRRRFHCSPREYRHQVSDGEPTKKSAL